MKKSKVSITLVTSFIAAMALTACNDVTANKKAVVTFTPYGASQPVEVITQDVYDSYRKTNSGVSKFYDKILEVLIRYKFTKGVEGAELSATEIENWAKNQVQEQKDKAKANAKSNNTSYDDEWKSILESNNVDDANGLKEKFIYEKEKEVITNWYSDNNAEKLKKEFIGVDSTGAKVTSDVSSAMPYHIRHILVKVDEASDAQAKFYRGTISEAQAKLLYDTVSTLASGKYSFSQVAKMYSEDGSASSGGDVGIMTNAATSGSLGMVNEFQLGLYAYDNLYDGDKAGADVIKEGLGFNSVVGTDKTTGNDITASDALADGLVDVPYEAFVNIGKYAKVTADKDGNKLANGSANVYPRNILWNKYLNLHNVFVIKNACTGASAFHSDHPEDEFDNLLGTAPYKADLPAFDTANGKTGFDAQGRLCDENGNVIVGVRSQYGLHLMIIEKSMYDFADLEDYYTTKLPGDDGYPVVDGKPSKDTYVAFIESQSNEDYKKRADDVKSKITSFDSTYDYRLYLDLQSELQVTFAEGLEELITSYIKATKDNNNYKQKDGLQKVWRTYTELLQVQEDNRDAVYTTINGKTGAESFKLTRLVSEKVAEDFFACYEGTGTSAMYTAFAEGGDYYYYA